MPTLLSTFSSPLFKLMFIATLSCFMAACVTPEYIINKPNSAPIVCSDPAGTACKVDVNVQWKGVAVHAVPDFFLDNVTRPGVLAPSTNSVIGIVHVPVGPHEVKVSGELSGQGGVANFGAVSSFSVIPAAPSPGSFTLTAQPRDILIERGTSGSVQINVARTAPFSGPVLLSLVSPPSGITAPATTIAAGAGSTSTNLPISVSNTVLPGSVAVAVTGSSGALSAHAPVSLNIIAGRTAGLFTEANPTPYNSQIPSSANSLTGGFRVDLALGGPSYPQGSRTASFFKGTQRIGQPVPFTIGTANNLAGAGFCPNTSASALTRGVVMSGMQPGFPSQNVITFVDLVGNVPNHAFPVDQIAQLGNVFHSFAPRVFFSPDCTLALIASVNKIGPSPNIIEVWDLMNGQSLHASMSMYTDIFRAEVMTVNGRQIVRVAVDTNTPNAQSYDIAIR